MLKKILRNILPNPLDRIINKAKAKGKTTFLLGWNRGLGDIALGLYPIVHKITEKIPEAKITFLVRKNLQEGFSLLKGIDILVAPNWIRGKSYNVNNTLIEIGKSPESFDVIISYPDPTYWISKLRGIVTPKLTWQKKWNDNYKKFHIENDLIGVQVEAETTYGLWRNWSYDRWNELFNSLQKKGKKVLLFGFEKKMMFHQENVIDIRGKTNLFDLLSIIKNRCSHLVLPDSGILSMAYYLDESFPIKVISLWGNSNHGILKQNVSSPNESLVHIPIIASNRDLSNVLVKNVMEHIDV